MKNLRGSVLTLLTAIVVASAANQVSAQLPPPGLAGSMPLPGANASPMYQTGQPFYAGQQGIIMPPPQAMYNMPAPAGYGPSAYGAMPYGAGAPMQQGWGVQPASYAPPQPFPSADGMAMPAGYEMGAGYGGYAGGGCDSCGGYGCAACSGYGGSTFGDRLIARLLPYAEGGQCAPRWYDATLDAMFLTRENAGRNIDFSSDGINGNPLLSTNDLDFQEELGFRFTGAHQIFAGATAEFTYFGLFNWDTAAVNRPAQFPNDIYSVLSQFGLDRFGGFDETDAAFQHSLSYSSTIDNFELNIRKRFTAPNCRLQYSWLAGVRYVYLLEDFGYNTIGGDDDLVTPGLQSRGSMNYNVRARNSLTGFQVGGDGWLNLTPGVNIGADIKAGVYGNYAVQNTNVLATTTTPAAATTFNESVHANDVAFVGDANFYFNWRLGPHWTIRAGYNFLFIDGVALGSENFNTAPPNILSGGVSTQTRVPTINDNGNAFYHGGFGGVEYMW